MKRLAPVFGLIAAIAIGVTIGLASCKSGDGERCQQDSDCADGICNKAEGVCAGNTNTNPIDAEPPLDGPPTDAMIDAPDAPPDT